MGGLFDVYVQRPYQCNSHDVMPGSSLASKPGVHLRVSKTIASSERPVLHESSDRIPYDTKYDLHFRDVGESESDRNFPSPLGEGLAHHRPCSTCCVGLHLISFR